MPRPLIGITIDAGHKPDRYQMPHGYAQGVELAGGLPMPIPFLAGDALIPEILSRIDGLLLTGGDDLDPALWGAPRHPNAIPIDPQRQAFEFRLLGAAEKANLPILGICLGCQVINVHRGGTLHQFLPDVARPRPIEHRRIGEQIRRHPVNIEPGTVLAEALGKTEVLANTYHKQSIDRLGRGLRINSTAPDGIIEGVEDPTRPLLLGVQWHPERLLDEADHLALFSLLVGESRRR